MLRQGLGAWVILRRMQEGPRVDVETARRLVEAAVRDATGREDKARGIVDARVAAAMRRSGRRIFALKVGVVLALVAVAFAAVHVERNRRATDVLAGEAGLGRTAAPVPSGTLPTRVLSGREIYAQNRGALYVLGYVKPGSVGGCCTAFAVGPSLLATNAHCVIACRERGGTPTVFQNESSTTRFRVLSMTGHPGYDAKSKRADSPDVGLVRVEGRLPHVVTLAGDAELWSIGPGDDAYVLGFPGRVMDPRAPVATFLSGRIGRVTGLTEEATTPAKAVLLQHDAVTRGGNSGSPIFDQYGNVIGIHAAHIDEEEDVEIGGKKTTVLASSPFRLGMRIDLLRGVPAP